MVDVRESERRGTADGGEGVDAPLAVFERLIDALNAHDLDGMVACFAPDYHSVQPLHPAREFRGAEQVRKNWSSMFTGLPDLRAEVLRTAVDGDTVWGETHWTATRTDGAPHEMMVLLILGITGGQIAWGRLYAEPVEREGAGIDAAMERTTGVRQG